jgi:hypothetical protein
MAPPLGQRLQVAPGRGQADRELLANLGHGDALLLLDKAAKLFLALEAGDGEWGFHKTLMN